jgi:anti-anti-sigma regulatory factor
MIIKISNELSEIDFARIESSIDKEIVFDLGELKFLSSRTITRMLLLNNRGKEVVLCHTNEHIRETIKILSLEEILRVQV